MKPLTLEWVEKAEDDWDAAQRLYRARNRTNYGLVCFHAQQCAEKYLKARLEEAGLAIRKTHDLILLLTQVHGVEPSWIALQPELTALNVYSVAIRYPGLTASKLNAQHSLKDCKLVRATIRLAFGLPV